MAATSRVSSLSFHSLGILRSYRSLPSSHPINPLSRNSTFGFLNNCINNSIAKSHDLPLLRCSFQRILAHKPIQENVNISTEPDHSNKNLGEGQRLSKVLAALGVASRRRSEELIFEGRVTVNRSVCKIPQARIDSSKDEIHVDGHLLSKKFPKKLYFALNKPKGYICSSGEKEFKSVLSLFDDFREDWLGQKISSPLLRLFTVGRLDVATTGLIIITNDGHFGQRLSHPSSCVAKEYIASITGKVSKKHLRAIIKGTDVDDVHCTPDSVELLGKHETQKGEQRSRLRIVVKEGRSHEVRELVRNAGLELHSLMRTRIGGFRLPRDLCEWTVEAGVGNFKKLFGN